VLEGVRHLMGGGKSATVEKKREGNSAGEKTAPVSGTEEGG